MHVLLGNQTHMALFDYETKKHRASLEKIFDNPKYRRKDSDMFTHRAGTGATSNTSDQVTMGESRYKEELVEKFCNTIADYLTDKSSHGKLDSVVLVCGPSMLGELRKKLPPWFDRYVKEEYSKNFYTEKEHELKKFLEKQGIV